VSFFPLDYKLKKHVLKQVKRSYAYGIKIIKLVKEGCGFYEMLLTISTANSEENFIGNRIKIEITRLI